MRPADHRHALTAGQRQRLVDAMRGLGPFCGPLRVARQHDVPPSRKQAGQAVERLDRKSTRLNSSHMSISYAVFCLKKKKKDSHGSRVFSHVHRAAPTLVTSFTYPLHAAD